MEKKFKEAAALEKKNSGANDWLIDDERKRQDSGR
jgi:hypothetical protein